MRPIFLQLMFSKRTVSKFNLWLSISLCIIAALSACGRKGDLVLPDSDKPASFSQFVNR